MSYLYSIMSYVLNVILFVKQNINSVLFKINPLCDKNETYEKLIWSFLFVSFK